MYRGEEWYILKRDKIPLGKGEELHMTRILLVEDDAAIARGLCYALEQEGFSMRHVSTLADALAALKEPADLLLLKTGLCKIRDTQPRVYEAQGAFLTPEVCRYLVETFPDLKAIGLDFLSVGTPANQLSKQAHRILFGCHNGKYIPAIEDMDLRPLFETETPLKSVIAAPLRLGKVDSSQVTVIGEFRE